MGDNKISEAVEAIAARFRSGNSVPVERASVPRNEWESLIAAFAHLQGEAVPVADWSKRGSEPTDWRNELLTLADHHGPIPAFARSAMRVIARSMPSHPQPAELSEVSGDSGGLAIPAGWKLVPIEPNWDMRNEGREFLIEGMESEPERAAYFLWKTMVAAAPEVL